MRNNRLPRVPVNWQRAAFAGNWFAELMPDDATELGAPASSRSSTSTADARRRRTPPRC